MREFMNGGVHPDFRGRGIGRELLAWQRARGEQKLAASDKRLPGWLVGYADRRAEGRRRLLEAGGFEVVRYFQTMERDLADPIPAVSPEGSVRIEAYRPEQAEAVHAARDDAFRDHWGSQPLSDEQFAGLTSGSFVAELSFVALVDDQIAGVLLTDVSEDDWPGQGFSSSYVSTVAVTRPYRGRRIAPSLLRAVLEASAARGLDKVVLDVDAENPTGRARPLHRHGVRHSAVARRGWSVPTDHPTRRYRLDIAYQGTDFNGWGRQPGLRTVQGTLEAALATIFRRAGTAPILTVAGRTDAGVHATGQVAHVDLTSEQEALLRKPHGVRPPLSAEEALQRRLNGILGPVADVVVLAASVAPDGFDARFSALWRRYEYRVADRASLRDPLQRHRTAWVSADLDVEAMDMAAHGLLGLHDFASYCKAREGATTIRTLQSFAWHRDADGVLSRRTHGGRLLPQHGPRPRRRLRRGGGGQARCGRPGGSPRREAPDQRLQGHAGARTHPARGRLPRGGRAGAAGRENRALRETVATPVSGLTAVPYSRRVDRWCPRLLRCDIRT